MESQWLNSVKQLRKIGKWSRLSSKLLLVMWLLKYHLYILPRKESCNVIVMNKQALLQCHTNVADIYKFVFSISLHVA